MIPAASLWTGHRVGGETFLLDCENICNCDCLAAFCIATLLSKTISEIRVSICQGKWYGFVFACERVSGRGRDWCACEYNSSRISNLLFNRVIIAWWAAMLSSSLIPPPLPDLASSHSPPQQNIAVHKVDTKLESWTADNTVYFLPLE